MGGQPSNPWPRPLPYIIVTWPRGVTIVPGCSAGRGGEGWLPLTAAWQPLITPFSGALNNYTLPPLETGKSSLTQSALMRFRLLTWPPDSWLITWREDHDRLPPHTTHTQTFIYLMPADYKWLWLVKFVLPIIEGTWAVNNGKVGSVRTPRQHKDLMVAGAVAMAGGGQQASVVSYRGGRVLSRGLWAPGVEYTPPTPHPHTSTEL